jgi:hypothetical protein
VVLVEGLDHAAELARVLPGWPVVAGPGAASRRGPLGDALRRGHELNLLRVRRAVVTAEGGRRLGLARVDVLVRADGGVGLPPIPDSAFAVPATRERPLLLVDCADRHHARLRVWSRRRQEAYRARGWAPAGVDPLVDAAVQFYSRNVGRSAAR